MKKLILLLILTLTVTSCEWDRHPVQFVEKTEGGTDLILYGNRNDYTGYNQDSTYYLLRTRYQECRIKDCGTKHYLDSIMPLRYQQIIKMQNDYDDLRDRTNGEPTLKIPEMKSSR